MKGREENKDRREQGNNGKKTFIETEEKGYTPINKDKNKEEKNY